MNNNDSVHHRIQPQIKHNIASHHLQEVYSPSYVERNYGNHLQGLVMRRPLEIIRQLQEIRSSQSVLEVGVSYRPAIDISIHNQQIVLSDMNLDCLKWLAHKDKFALVQFTAADLFHLPFRDATFGAVVAANVLDHVVNAELALIELARIVSSGGWIVLVIPTDPGVAWRVGQSLGPRRRARRQGVPYDYIMSLEHRSTVFQVIHSVSYLFDKFQIEYWPTKIPLIDLNLFVILTIQIP